MSNSIYKPSGFSQKDFRKLSELLKSVEYQYPSGRLLRSILYKADFRDKRIQHLLSGWEHSEVLEALLCDFYNVITYMGSRNLAIQGIVNWRIKLNK